MSQAAKQASKLTIYSLGKVATNKALDSDEIEVIPIEHLLLIDGNIGSNLTTTTVTGTDADWQAYGSAMTTDNVIKARWLPLDNGYQQTSPDVRRDERVLLWRFGDSNDFYWTSLGLDNHLRRLETVVHMYSDTKDEKQMALTQDNSYVHTISTHEGHVTFTTSNENGEPTRWLFQLNTKEGTFLIAEDNGNEVFIDAVNTYISVLNADKSWLELDKVDIRMTCENDMLLKCGNDMTIDVGNDMTITVGNNQTFNIGNNVDGTVGSNYTLNVSSNYSLTASDVSVSSPNSSFSGNVSIGGNLSTSGNATTGGNIQAGGIVQAAQVTSAAPMKAPAYL